MFLRLAGNIGINGILFKFMFLLLNWIWLNQLTSFQSLQRKAIYFQIYFLPDRSTGLKKNKIKCERTFPTTLYRRDYIEQK